MAKKAVATFKAGTLKKMVKCIRMDKSPKTGAYVFTEQLVELLQSHIRSTAPSRREPFIKSNLSPTEAV